jgi:hypothetical protein
MILFIIWYLLVYPSHIDASMIILSAKTDTFTGATKHTHTHTQNSMALSPRVNYTDTDIKNVFEKMSVIYGGDLPKQNYTDGIVRKMMVPLLWPKHFYE